MNFDVENIPSQNGRIAIVTGANNGVGFETTVGLARAGFQVIMACRSIERAEKAKAEIVKRVQEAKLDIIELDLSRKDSVHKFAAEFKSQYDRLDVLINNAGVLDYSGRKNQVIFYLFYLCWLEIMGVPGRLIVEKVWKSGLNGIVLVYESAL